MKKVSVYFTDRQAEALESKASHAGITFAEALRRALDEWLTLQSIDSTTPMDLQQLRDYVVRLEAQYKELRDAR